MTNMLKQSSFTITPAASYRHEWDNVLAAFEGTGLIWRLPERIQRKPLREIEAAFLLTEVY